MTRKEREEWIFEKEDVGISDPDFKITYENNIVIYSFYYFICVNICLWFVNIFNNLCCSVKGGNGLQVWNLIKANQTATILPGEGFFVPIYSKNKEDIVEIDPRREAPKGFVLNHLQEIKEGEIHICNMSEEPVKIKKNTLICNIKQTCKVAELYEMNS